jgi:hypothetical protein
MQTGRLAGSPWLRCASPVSASSTGRRWHFVRFGGVIDHDESLDLELFLVSNHGRAVSVVRCVTSRCRCDSGGSRARRAWNYRKHTWMPRPPWPGAQPPSRRMELRWRGGRARWSMARTGTADTVPAVRTGRGWSGWYVRVAGARSWLVRIRTTQKCGFDRCSMLWWRSHHHVQFLLTAKQKAEEKTVSRGAESTKVCSIEYELAQV